jgi:hypothetical protein
MTKPMHQRLDALEGQRSRSHPRSRLHGTSQEPSASTHRRSIPPADRRILRIGLHWCITLLRRITLRRRRWRWRRRRGLIPSQQTA